MSIPYMPFYVSDFDADTGHLTLEEDGAYNRLLRLCWRTPGCSVPDDNKWIARRLKLDSDTFENVVAPIIEEFFTIEKGRVFQARQLDEFNKTQAKAKAARENGKKGGRPTKPKKINNKDEPTGFNQPNPEKSYPEPEPEPEPDIDKKEPMSLSGKSDVPKRKKYSGEFETFWREALTTPNMSKKSAWGQWQRLDPESRLSARQSLPAFKAYMAEADHTPQHVERYLSKRTFDGYAGASSSVTFDEQQAQLAALREAKQARM